MVITLFFHLDLSLTLNFYHPDIFLSHPDAYC